MAQAQTLTPPAEFPVPEFDGAAMAFGAPDGAYLSREQLGDWYGFGHTPFHRAVETLFYNGGTLAEHGLKWKDGVDGKKAGIALRALLGSFAPTHEIKIGTCAVALANWCDYTPPTP